MVEASHVRQAATPSLKQHRYLAEEFILAAPYNSKGEKSSADVIKGGAYKVRSKVFLGYFFLRLGRRIQRWPYRSEGQSRSTEKQPVIRNNQDSHFNAIHLCPSSGRQANL
ncbi:hypothetical protein T02_7203 [Trichinella nativa]|uniref:Uncharacterized protein n=1 Tax=Trichinella nativa TaxID=6335 RepID=A0A0V1KMB9_9BILA|nr:hypothetical protein T02_7203 [Trichinella nativa]